MTVWNMAKDTFKFGKRWEGKEIDLSLEKKKKLLKSVILGEILHTDKEAESGMGNRRRSTILP